jgi:hypothetical protein
MSNAPLRSPTPVRLSQLDKPDSCERIKPLLTYAYSGALLTPSISAASLALKHRFKAMRLLDATFCSRKASAAPKSCANLAKIILIYQSILTVYHQLFTIQVNSDFTQDQPR